VPAASEALGATLVDVPGVEAAADGLALVEPADEQAETMTATPSSIARGGRRITVGAPGLVPRMPRGGAAGWTPSVLPVTPGTLESMTDQSDTRAFSPGLEGVVAGETALSRVDGANGRLVYRGYPIGELVVSGSFASVAELLWTDAWRPDAHLACGPLPDVVRSTLEALPRDVLPMDALRTAVSAWGAATRATFPPTVEQARTLTAMAPTALAAAARLREGLEPIDPDPSLGLAAGFLYQLTGDRPAEADARALDAYFVVGAEHGFNASTFTARVITSTRSDLASAVVGAIGALKGPLHGGAPSEVVSQLHEIGSPERAEAWIRDAVGRGERLMGFGHRVYRAYDPRAAALRTVAEQLAGAATWLATAVAIEDVALRVLAELKPHRVIKTNVEYYAAAVLQGINLPPHLYPAVFALARHAGWTAHCLEQAADNRLIRPDVRYVGPSERSLPS
jgi:citrate synthase